MSSRPKLLYVVTQGEWGGAERYIYDLATHLSKDFDITVAIGEPEGKKDLQNAIEDLRLKIKDFKNIELVQLTHLTRQISPVHDILAVFELAKLYRQLRPAIVHLNSSKAGIIGSLAKIFNLQSSIFIVYTVHGWVFNEPLSWLRRKSYLILERYTARYKDKLILLSEQEKNQAITILGVPENRCVVIPHQIDLAIDTFPKEAARETLAKYCGLENNSRGYWVGTIANYYKTKGLDLLIEAVGKQKNHLLSTRFVLIGDGPERALLMNLIKKYGLEDIVFLAGTIPGAARFLKAFDYFILPSRKEGLPYALLEADAAGVPIITTSVGAIPELASSHPNWKLIPPYSTVAIEEILIHLHDRDTTAIKSGGGKGFADELQTTLTAYRSLLRFP